jgi:hypothetical protein
MAVTEHVSDWALLLAKPGSRGKACAGRFPLRLKERLEFLQAESSLFDDGAERARLEVSA